MFWQEEDVQPAVNAANSIFGEPNQYFYGDNVFKNVTIMTREYGKIWFGDVQLDETLEGGFRDSLRSLSKRINQRVCFSLASGTFEFSDSVCESAVIVQPLTTGD
jgi:hypothetical protein